MPIGKLSAKLTSSIKKVPVIAPASPARSGKRLSALKNSSQLNGVCTKPLAAKASKASIWIGAKRGLGTLGVLPSASSCDRRRDREGHLHRLADKARIGGHPLGDGIGSVVGKHGEQRRIVHIGQIGLETVSRQGGEVAARRRSGLDLGGIDIDVELEARAAAVLDHDAAILQPLEIADLAPS